MAASVMFPLQAGVVGRLLGDAGVTALVGSRVYDSPEQPGGADVTYPWVQVTVSDQLPWDTFGDTGADSTVTIDVWSRVAARTTEARAIMDAVHAALHRREADITVAGHEVVLAQVEFQRVMRDPDGVTAHGVMRVNFITEPTL